MLTVLKCPPRARGQCYSKEHRWSYLQVAFSQLSSSLQFTSSILVQPQGPVLIACKQVSVPTPRAPLLSSLSSFLAPGEFPLGLLSLSGYPRVFMMRCQPNYAFEAREFAVQPQLHPIIYWESCDSIFSCLTAAPVLMATLFKYGHCKSTPHFRWSFTPTIPDQGFSSPPFTVITPLLGHLFQVFS